MGNIQGIRLALTIFVITIPAAWIIAVSTAWLLHGLLLESRTFGRVIFTIAGVALAIFVACVGLHGPITPARWLGAWCGLAVAMAFGAVGERDASTTPSQSEQDGTTSAADEIEEGCQPMILAFQQTEAEKPVSGGAGISGSARIQNREISTSSEA